MLYCVPYVYPGRSHHPNPNLSPNVTPILNPCYLAGLPRPPVGLNRALLQVHAHLPGGMLLIALLLPVLLVPQSGAVVVGGAKPRRMLGAYQTAIWATPILI